VFPRWSSGATTSSSSPAAVPFLRSRRLLDMVDGRSKMVFKTWLNRQSTTFRAGIEVVAMDGFTGFKTAVAETVPDAVAVMDPFHVVALAGDALERCRQRVQQQTRGHRGRTGDALYGIRRVLRTGSDLLTDRQRQRLTAVFATEQHVEVEATWGVYQRIVAAYRNHDRAAAETELKRIIATITAAVPTALTELIRLGRTLERRAADVLAYFDRAGTSNGPTEAINGRLEHLRGSPLGFRNLTNYIARSLLETGGFKPQLRLNPDEPFIRLLRRHSQRKEHLCSLLLSTAGAIPDAQSISFHSDSGQATDSASRSREEITVETPSPRMLIPYKASAISIVRF
jgi:transposase